MSQFFTGLRHWAPYVKYLALLFGILLLADYLQSGPIRMRNVSFYDVQLNQRLQLSLPLHDMQDKGNGTYRFAFNIPDHWLNHIFPLRIIPSGCITELKINGTLFDPKALKDKHPCDRENGINAADLPDWSSAPIEVTENVTNKKVDLYVARASFFSGFQRTAFFIAALYVWILSSITSWKECKAVHYGLITCAVLLESLWPYHQNVEGWQWWGKFLAFGLAIGFVVLLAGAWPPIQRIYYHIDCLLHKIQNVPPKIFVLFCVAAFFVLAASLSLVLYGGLPHVADTHAQFMQSKIFAEGKLYETINNNFFDFQFTTHNDKYYSNYLPGHSLLLAIGQWLGAPWLINPFMGALTVWAVFLLANELGGKSAGYIAIGLMMVSPMIVFMSSEYMNHVSCMFFLTMFLYAYIRLCKTGHWKYAIIAGSCVGYASLIRIQSVVPFALPVALHALFTFFRSPKTQAIPLALLAGSFSVFAAFLGYYNYKTTGDWWRPQAATGHFGHRPLMIMEFLHASRWGQISRDLYRAMGQIKDLNQELFGWPTSSLWLVFLLPFFKNIPRYTALLYGCFIGQCLGLVFIYPDNGTLMSPRYVYESTGLLMVLSALGLQALAASLTRLSQQHSIIQQPKAMVFAAIASLVLLAFPYRISALYRLYGDNFWEGNWGYYDMFLNTVEKPALVFIRPYYAYVWVYFTEPPQENSPIIFAQDYGPDNQKLMDQYPKRHVYTAEWWNVQKVR